MSRDSVAYVSRHHTRAHGRTRTCDTSFRKRVLYPLSYVGHVQTRKPSYERLNRYWLPDDFDSDDVVVHPSI